MAVSETTIAGGRVERRAVFLASIHACVPSWWQRAHGAPPGKRGVRRCTKPASIAFGFAFGISELGLGASQALVGVPVPLRPEGGARTCGAALGQWPIPRCLCHSFIHLCHHNLCFTDLVLSSPPGCSRYVHLIHRRGVGYL